MTEMRKAKPRDYPGHARVLVLSMVRDLNRRPKNQPKTPPPAKPAAAVNQFVPGEA